MDPLVWIAWAWREYGVPGVAILVLVLERRQIAAALGKFLPWFGEWMDRRAKAKAESDARNKNGQAAVLQHVIASDTRGEMTQVSMIERVLAMLDSTVDRLFEDRDATRADLKEFQKLISELRSVVARHNDLLGGHGQNIARLADEVEGVKTATASMNGKLDSLGAWMETMQNLRREVSG